MCSLRSRTSVSATLCNVPTFESRDVDWKVHFWYTQKYLGIWVKFVYERHRIKVKVTSVYVVNQSFRGYEVHPYPYRYPYRYPQIFRGPWIYPYPQNIDVCSEYPQSADGFYYTTLTIATSISIP